MLKNPLRMMGIDFIEFSDRPPWLTSYALRSPCDQFGISINEANEAKSQINEFLEE